MYRVGLTGGIGSGKSTFAQFLRDLGACVIDADRIARDIVAPGEKAYEQIIQRFGNAIIQADQSLNRAMLRQIVFNDPQARHDLESIIHPKVRTEAARQRALAAQSWVIEDIPLLVESNQASEFTRVVVIDLDTQTQYARAQSRETYPQSQLRAIIASQASRSARCAVASDIINNDGTKDRLEHAAVSLYYRLCHLADISHQI